MTREKFAEKIRWEWIIWIMGFVNVGAMLPQIIKTIQTQKVDNLSLETFILYFFIQVALSLEGYFKRSNMLMICLGLSAVVSATMIALIWYLRYYN